MFTNNNAHKYIRIGNDEQVDMDTRSDFLDYVWGSVIFLEVTANGVTIFRDRCSSVASGEELEARRRRAGGRKVKLSKEVVVGIQYVVQYVVAHRVFAKGEHLRGGRKMTEL